MCHLGFSHFAQKNFTHSFWLNFMMAAILNSSMLDSDTAILDLDTLLSSLRFTQKHSHSTLNLTPTNSIWLIWEVSHLEFCHLGLSHFEQKKNFIHSFSPNFMMAAIFNSTILDSNSFWTKKFNSFMISSTWILPSWILPFWIQPFCTK